MTDVDASAAPENDTHSYLVVARRYRPRTFDELVGQSHVVQALVNAIETDRVGHAYLFTGARGVGKTSTARIFAKCLNAPNGPTVHPDESSDICRRIDAGDDIDVIEIDGASNRGIDEIRQLRAGVNIRPSRARYKIYIIDEVHMLTSAAFNALLKTLEEPPPHVKFIFCTTDPDKIPITVLSRCQRYDFAPVDTAELVARLEQILREEGREAEPEALQLVARHATGSVRDSQSLLEQLLAFTSEKVTVADVHRMFGTAPDAHLAELLDRLATCDTPAALEILDRSLGRGIDPGQLAEQLASCFRDAMFVATGAKSELRWHTGSDVTPAIDRLAQTYGLSGVLAALQVLDQTVTRIRHSSQARTILEMALVRIGHLRQLKQIESWLAGGVPPKVPQTSGPAVSAPSAAGTSGDGLRSPQGTSAPAPSSPPSPSPPSQLGATTPGAPEPAHREACSSKDGGEAVAEPAQATETGASVEAAQPMQVGQASVINGVGENGEEKTPDPWDLWQEVCRRVRDRIGPYGEFATAAHWRTPNALVVEFPHGYTLQRERCERPAARSVLQETVSQLAGRPVQLELVQGGSVAEPQGAPSESPLEQRRRRERAPLVRRAMDLFDAEVTRIDEPPDRRS